MIVSISYLAFNTQANPCDVRVSWLEFFSQANPCDVRVSWLEFFSQANPCDVRVSWLSFDAGTFQALRKLYNVTRAYVTTKVSRSVLRRGKHQVFIESL